MEEEYLDTDTFTFPAAQAWSSFPGPVPDYPHYLRTADGEPFMVPADVSTRPRTTPTSISSFINSFDLHTPAVPDDVDLRALDYVDPPNENLICAICASAFVTPMELGCGHIFCRQCLYDHLQSGIQSASTCPKCRQDVDGVNPVSTILSHLLDELEVECPNRASGCDLHIKRYTIRDHVLQYCPFMEVPCPSPDCELLIERRYAGEDCLHSYVECEDCLEQIMEKDMHIHETELCPDGFVLCRFCSDEIRRVNISTHNTTCDMFLESCPGQVVGCKFHEIRKTTIEHAKTCPMAIMAPHIALQNTIQAQTQAENDRLKAQLSGMETRLDDLETICKQLSSTIKMERRRSMMPPEGTVSATRLEDLTGRVDDLITDHTSRLDNVTSESARLTMFFTNENLRNQQQFHTLNAALASLRAQVSHLAARSNSGSNGSTNRGATGGATGGGVALSSAQERGVLYSERREPPKL